MQTLQRVIIYIIIILVCLLLYKYRGKFTGQVSQLNQDVQVSLIENSDENLQLMNINNMISDDYENKSLDVSLGGVSELNITEEDSVKGLESLYGETN